MISQIKNFDGYYVDTEGKIYSTRKNGGYRRNMTPLQLRKDKDGYFEVGLYRNKKRYFRRVHRLVAEAFIPNPENKPYIDHIDTDPTNNHVWNLRWVTQKENALNPLTREHISKSKMGHPYWGRPLTDEERKKISDANRGRKLSEETKKKLSEAHKRLAKKRMEENRYETE